MMKSILAVGVSVIAFGAVSAEAKTFGHIAGSVNYLSVDDIFFGGKDTDRWQYDVQGAVGFDLTPNWNLQLNADFTRDNWSNFAVDEGVDALSLGGIAFWRDPSKGLLGVEVNYTHVDFASQSNDGYLLALRGEYFGAAYTIGGRIYWAPSDFYTVDLDTVGGGLSATFYTSDKMAVSLRGNYQDYSFNGNSNDQYNLDITADVEYLFDNNLSLTGTLGYNTGNAFGSDFDTLTVGAKLKFYFGTEGTLANQHRTSTLEPTVSNLGIIWFD